MLRPDNARKTTAFYVSFLELGRHLRNEDAWLCLGVLKVQTAHQVQGGLSCAFKMLLRHVFLSTPSFSTGVSLELSAGPTLFWAKLSNILGDEAALKSTWSVKGASGLKPCMLCKNVCAQRSGLPQHDVNNYLVDLACSDFSKFDLCTDNDLWQMQDTLLAQQPVLSNAALDRLEKATGMTCNPNGILADVELRAHVKPTCSTFDSMHCYLSNPNAIT